MMRITESSISTNFGTAFLRLVLKRFWFYICFGTILYICFTGYNFFVSVTENGKILEHGDSLETYNLGNYNLRKQANSFLIEHHLDEKIFDTDEFSYISTNLRVNLSFISDDIDTWLYPESWVTEREIYPAKCPHLGSVLYKMATTRITRAAVGYKGTQMKTRLVVDGGQYLVFKPKFYQRDHVIVGDPYAGRDRHNGEIAAFHLDRILNFRRAPLVVGRKVALAEEIRRVSDASLLDTFFNVGNETCFYGVCTYCFKDDPACSDKGILEGSMTLWLPLYWTLESHRFPWARTYRHGVSPKWEIDDNFCQHRVIPVTSEVRLLDMVDLSIFDYLIGNADRHSYETFELGGVNAVILHMDNGKSFGNPNHDERTILAPLYQCCRLRLSTLSVLKKLTDGRLSSLLTTSTKYDPLFPILNESNLLAVDRRLKTILVEIESCIQIHGRGNVVKA